MLFTKRHAFRSRVVASITAGLRRAVPFFIHRQLFPRAGGESWTAERNLHSTLIAHLLPMRRQSPLSTGTSHRRILDARASNNRKVTPAPRGCVVIGRSMEAEDCGKCLTDSEQFQTLPGFMLDRAISKPDTRTSATVALTCHRIAITPSRAIIRYFDDGAGDERCVPDAHLGDRRLSANIAGFSDEGAAHIASGVAEGAVRRTLRDRQPITT